MQELKIKNNLVGSLWRTLSVAGARGGRGARVACVYPRALTKQPNISSCRLDFTESRKMLLHEPLFVKLRYATP